MPRNPFFIALLVVVAVGVVVVVGRRNWRQEPASEARSTTKSGMPSEKEPGSEEAQAAPTPAPPKVTQLSAAARAHLAEKAFIAKLRAVFLSMGDQPGLSLQSKEWVAKLDAVSGEGLPTERLRAWQTYLDSWRALHDPAKAGDPLWKEQGRQAAATLNAMLKEHGDGDIRL